MYVYILFIYEASSCSVEEKRPSLVSFGFAEGQSTTFISLLSTKLRLLWVGTGTMAVNVGAILDVYSLRGSIGREAFP